jgi:hypothetical protein
MPVVFAVLGANGATLWSQPPGSPPGGTIPSQMWVDPTQQNDSEIDSVAYDEFVLSQGTTLTHLEWWGDAAPTLGFTIEFWNQDTNTIAVQPDLTQFYGHAPLAQEIVTAFVQESVSGGQYHFAYELTTPISLSANSRYFVAIHGNTPGYWDTWGWAQSQSGGGKMFYYQYHGSLAGGPYYSYRTDRAYLIGDATPPPPRLTVFQSATNSAVVWWPTNAVGFELQEAWDLNATNWIKATNVVTVAGTNYQAAVLSPAGNQFFRLRHP